MFTVHQNPCTPYGQPESPLVILASLFLAILSLMLQWSAQAEISGQARVIDGDTIEVAGQHIRLHGIDAPELRQTCWDKSGEFMCAVGCRAATAPPVVSSSWR